MGRPTKICEDHIKYMDEYIEACKDEWIQLKKSETRGEKSDSDSWENKLEVNLPTYAGLILYWRSKDKKLSIHKDTIDDWKNKGLEENCDEIYERFSDSLASLLLLQEQMLVNGGIANKYSPVVTKLMLNVNHGYKETEKREVEHSGSINLSDFFTPESKEEKESLVK